MCDINKNIGLIIFLKNQYLSALQYYDNITSVVGGFWLF